MRPRADYTALTVVVINGVRGYNVGDDVPASVVENLNLVVGRDVMPTSDQILPRPAGNAKRADWAAYWVGQGLTADEVDEMTRDEMAAKEPLIEVSDEPTPPFVVAEPAHPASDLVAEQAVEQIAADHRDQPGPNARKQDWVDYAIWRGMDERTAKESTVPQLEAADYDTLFGPKE